LPGEQSRLVVGICGVVGRLHSNQGLAQSNNNTKLNNSAKTYRRLLGTKCKEEQYRERGPQETKEGTEQKDNRPCSTFLYALVFFYRSQPRLQSEKDVAEKGKRRCGTGRVRLEIVFFLTFFLFLSFPFELVFFDISNRMDKDRNRKAAA
jgi:hypothetical protein